MLLATGEEEGNTFDHSIRLFDIVTSSFTGDLSGSSIVEKEVSIDDLVNLGESTILFPLRMEEKEEFPMMDAMEEETTREMCFDHIFIDPEVSSPPMSSQQHFNLSMDNVYCNILNKNLSRSIRQPLFNFKFLVDGSLWNNFSRIGNFALYVF